MTGTELKELRTKYGLTQSQVAEGIGVARERLSEWESGKFDISKAYQKLLDMYFNDLEKKQ